MSHSKSEIEAAIQSFLSSGGEITRLRPATKRDVEKARRMAFHRDRASNGNERSKAVLNKAELREKTMIFNRIERNKA